MNHQKTVFLSFYIRLIEIEINHGPDEQVFRYNVELIAIIQYRFVIAPGS